MKFTELQTRLVNAYIKNSPHSVMNYNVEINCHFAHRTIHSKEITGLENLIHAAKSLRN